MRATDIIWKNFIHYDKMHKYFLLKNDEMNRNLIHNRHSYGHNQDIFWIHTGTTRSAKAIALNLT